MNPIKRSCDTFYSINTAVVTELAKKQTTHCKKRGIIIWQNNQVWCCAFMSFFRLFNKTTDLIFAKKKFGVHNESAVLHTTILLDYVCICLCVGAISLHILLCLIKTWFLSYTVCKFIHPSLILIEALPICQSSRWKS